MNILNDRSAQSWIYSYKKELNMLVTVTSFLKTSFRVWHCLLKHLLLRRIWFIILAPWMIWMLLPLLAGLFVFCFAFVFFMKLESLFVAMVATRRYWIVWWLLTIDVFFYLLFFYYACMLLGKYFFLTLQSFDIPLCIVSM